MNADALAKTQNSRTVILCCAFVKIVRIELRKVRRIEGIDLNEKKTIYTTSCGLFPYANFAAK